MQDFDLTLENLDQLFPAELTQAELARAKTMFLKELSLQAHEFYQGKVQVLPKAGLFGFNWFNVWYTPGVSSVSTAIRDNNNSSFQLSNRGNTVAVVSDSTRVLGDGDCTPPGGLGVMEGKALLMKYLGGVDAFPLCINSRNEEGIPQAEKIIDFVKMLEPSCGAINLEDISQPNCYKVLDELQEACDIPVWHDDAQGTACVTMAGLFNALRLAEKDISQSKFVLLGAGASNTTIARLIMAAGGDPQKLYVFDSKGGLHKERHDIAQKPEYYRKWELCTKTNPERIRNIEIALQDADVLIALSKPGPDTVKPGWIKKMAAKPIVFACANPVPEIYPYAAHEAGAFIVATGRGDFPNQVNNSLGFPGILKGALLVKAKRITDNMALAAAKALADFAAEKGLKTDYIIPNMEETAVFPKEAAEVAMQAIKDGVARTPLSFETVYSKAQSDINRAREQTRHLHEQGYIDRVPEKLFENALNKALQTVRKE
jgi:malate dehydrogenase (oxaloacetate-decarboxylating)